MNTVRILVVGKLRKAQSKKFHSMHYFYISWQFYLGRIIYAAELLKYGSRASLANWKRPIVSHSFGQWRKSPDRIEPGSGER